MADPTGACGNADLGTCQDGLTEQECAQLGNGYSWVENDHCNSAFPGSTVPGWQNPHGMRSGCTNPGSARWGGWQLDYDAFHERVAQVDIPEVGIYRGQVYLYSDTVYPLQDPQIELPFIGSQQTSPMVVGEGRPEIEDPIPDEFDRYGKSRTWLNRGRKYGDLCRKTIPANDFGGNGFDTGVWMADVSFDINTDDCWEELVDNVQGLMPQPSFFEGVCPPFINCANGGNMIYAFGVMRAGKCRTQFNGGIAGHPDIAAHDLGGWGVVWRIIVGTWCKNESEQCSANPWTNGCVGLPEDHYSGILLRLSPIFPARFVTGPTCNLEGGGFCQPFCGAHCISGAPSPVPEMQDVLTPKQYERYLGLWRSRYTEVANGRYREQALAMFAIEELWGSYPLEARNELTRISQENMPEAAGEAFGGNPVGCWDCDCCRVGPCGLAPILPNPAEPEHCCDHTPNNTPFLAAGVGGKVVNGYIPIRDLLNQGGAHQFVDIQEFINITGCLPAGECAPDLFPLTGSVTFENVRIGQFTGQNHLYSNYGETGDVENAYGIEYNERGLARDVEMFSLNRPQGGLGSGNDEPLIAPNILTCTQEIRPALFLPDFRKDDDPENDLAPSKMWIAPPPYDVFDGCPMPVGFRARVVVSSNAHNGVVFDGVAINTHFFKTRRNSVVWFFGWWDSERVHDRVVIEQLFPYIPREPELDGFQWEGKTNIPYGMWRMPMWVELFGQSQWFADMDTDLEWERRFVVGFPSAHPAYSQYVPQPYGGGGSCLFWGRGARDIACSSWGIPNCELLSCYVGPATPNVVGYMSRSEEAESHIPCQPPSNPDHPWAGWIDCEELDFLWRQWFGPEYNQSSTRRLHRYPRLWTGPLGVGQYGPVPGVQTYFESIYDFHVPSSVGPGWTSSKKCMPNEQVPGQDPEITLDGKNLDIFPLHTSWDLDDGFAIDFNSNVWLHGDDVVDHFQIPFPSANINVEFFR